MAALGLSAAEPTESKPGVNWTAVQARVRDLLQQGRMAESEKTLEASIKAARELGETSTGFTDALNDLGTIYHDAGRFVDAERVYKEALSQWARIPGANPNKGIVVGNLAGLRLSQGKLSEAERLYLKAEQVLTSTEEVDRASLAFVICGLADVYWQARNYDDARRLAERAASMLESKGRRYPQMGAALTLLGKIAWHEQRPADAERLFREALEIWRATLPREHPTYAAGLTSLAVVLSGKNPNEAEELFRRALQVGETHSDREHVFTGFTLVLYARHLENTKRKAEAKELKRRGEKILAEHFRENRLGQTFDIKAFQQRSK